ncbi:hypothetical protein M2103_002016 [Ereboglobus sp. PH5-5]|uniref:hypothetical protein n=1 Tax=Ereboglobus sp. PH5-5 TaxID=2940529 RepID=UPI002405BE46|nr:hypothetical protein [Ereboglobus sp. PH5-5]MDF9833783.1 hypothetical protein [Ereboglobus sp. PH5-5]
MKALTLFLFMLSVLFCAGCISREYRAPGRLAVLQENAERLDLGQEQVAALAREMSGSCKITSIERITPERIKICSEDYHTRRPAYEDIYIARKGEKTVQLVTTLIYLQRFVHTVAKEPNQVAETVGH